MKELARTNIDEVINVYNITKEQIIKNVKNNNEVYKNNGLNLLDIIDENHVITYQIGDLNYMTPGGINMSTGKVFLGKNTINLKGEILHEVINS